MVEDKIKGEYCKGASSIVEFDDDKISIVNVPKGGTESGWIYELLTSTEVIITCYNCVEYTLKSNA